MLFWLFFLAIFLFLFLKKKFRSLHPNGFVLSQRQSQKKVFFITGSASGIGFHVTDILAQKAKRGEEIYILAADLNEGQLQTHLQSSWPTDKVAICKLDVRDESSWAKAIQIAVERFGQIDVLLNIAGYLSVGYIWEDSLEISRQIDVNFKGVALGMQAVSKVMIQKETAGHIVNISSLAGLGAITGIGVYSATKHAVRALSLAEYHKLKTIHNIDVSVLCPDAVNTPMLDKQIHQPAACLSFSGESVLTVQDVADALFLDILPYRTVEVWLPISRGYLALGSYLLYPLITALGISDYFEKKGKLKQQEYQKAHKKSQ